MRDYGIDSQDKVEDMALAIEAAIDNLQKADAITDTDGPSVGTGDNTPVWFYAALLAGSAAVLAAAAFIFRKRRV